MKRLINQLQFLAVIFVLILLRPFIHPYPEPVVTTPLPTPVPSPVPTPSPTPSPLARVFDQHVLDWEDSILHWAETYDLDPNIIAIIMQIESCGNPTAYSHAGAMGLFQVMPFHFAASEDPWDPDTNAMRGLLFYNRQLDYTNGDIYRSFAGYNGGYRASGGAWNTWAYETQRYYLWAKGIYEDIQAGLQTSPTLQKWMEAGGASLCNFS